MVVAKMPLSIPVKGPQKAGNGTQNGVVAAMAARVKLGEKLEEICLYALCDWSRNSAQVEPMKRPAADENGKAGATRLNFGEG